jgi:hypothetical protein
MRDLYNTICADLALAPAVQTADAQGPAIHVKGIKALAFVVNTGAIAGAGVFGVTIQESQDGSTGWTNADAAVIDTDAPAALAASSTYRLGYLGFAPYVRLSLDHVSGTSIAAGAVAVSLPLDRPAI